MEIIPAIDIKSGRCVRLFQGDFRKETIYSDDPLAVALRWQSEGACRLHVVDLDGASIGTPANLDVIKLIAERVDIPIQVGGGIRSFEVATGLLDAGVDRVVLGTAAVLNPGLVMDVSRERGSDSMIVAVDARDGRVSIKGWTERTSITVEELVQRMDKLGARRFIYTDIARDGTLTEPNFASIREMVQGTAHPVLASGGVSSREHIRELATTGVEGAILGKALYSGNLSFKEAKVAAT